MSSKGTKLIGFFLFVVALLSVALWQAFQLRSLRQDVSANQVAIGHLVEQSAKNEKSGRKSGRNSSVPAVNVVQKQPMAKVLDGVAAGKGQPPPFVDITSGYGKSRSDKANCQSTCQALADCTLDGTACRGANTKNHDRIVDRCLDACKSDLRFGIALNNKRDCVEKIAHAKARLAGFAGFCDGKD